MDPRLILAGQTVNPVNALAMGNQAGQQQNDMRYQQDYRAAVQQYGAGAVGGDQASMNALAAFDPQVAQNLASNQLGMDQTRLGMDATRQNMDMQRRDESRLTEEMAMQVRESLAKQSAADVQASRDNLESILNGGAQFAAQGDRAGYERFLTERGVDPAQYPLDDFPAIAATMGGVLDLYNEALDRNAGPDPMAAIEMQQAQVNLDQSQFDLAADQTGVGGDLSAAEEQINRLMETGLDRNTAIGVADGRLTVSRDAVTGNAQIIDRATGTIVGQNEAATPAQAIGEGASSMPEGTDFETATGVRGFLAQLANTTSDALGAGLVDPNNETATQAMQNLATNTMITLADGVAGRPSNFLLEQFQKLTSTPNSIFQGPGRTREKLNQTRDMISQAIAMNSDILLSDVSSTMRAQAQANIARLTRLMNDYDIVIDSFGSRSENAPAADLEDRLRAYE